MQNYEDIENYEEMMTIFGTGQATGKYAMGSNEALGSPSEVSDCGIKNEPSEVEYKGTKTNNVGATNQGGGCSTDGKEGGSNKRKRSVFTDEDTTMFIHAVNDVAAAIRETKPEKPEIMHPDLYGAVMYQPGFPDESLIVAYSHLLDNKAQGDAFVGMSESHRVLWLRTWLAKHYFL